ncbi:MAG: histidine phosphatase family protein [Pseudomonadota bacterium]
MKAQIPLIYAVRHGLTEWNVEGRLQGARDIPLNTTGRRQAESCGHTLKAHAGQSIGSFDFVASPLLRTRQTMELLRGAMGLDVKNYSTDVRLIELSFGDWEGRTLEEVAAVAPDKVKTRAANKWDFQPPGKHAESYEILSWRVAAWLNEVNRPTVCVCHGGIMRVILHLIAGMPAQEAAEFSIPQDKILKVAGSRLDWISETG